MKIFLLAIIACALGISSVSAQTNFFESFDGTKIAFSDEGSGNAIVLLHGFLNSGKSWENTKLKNDLLEKGYRVIVPDLRGCGQSDKPQEDKFYQDNAEIKDLKLLVDHLKIQHYAAIGYSRGSIILAELLTEDARISKAVLGGMGIDFTYPHWERRVAFANAFDGEVSEMTRGAVDYAKSINADFRSLHLQQKYQPSTSREELGKIKPKILVIAGDADFDNGNPEALSKVFKNSKLAIVPGDHNGTWKIQEFSDEILSFL